MAARRRTAQETKPAPDHGPEERLLEAGRTFMGVVEALDGLGLTFTDLLLSADMVGYERIGGSYSDMRDMQPPERTLTVRRSRIAWQREPLVDRAVKTVTELTFSRPWSFTAVDEGFQQILDEFLGAPRNHRVFSRQAAQRLSNALLVDGEVPVVFYTEAPERITARTMDPLQFLDPICNPEDKDEVWYWPRLWVDAENQRHLWLYRDWDFTTDDGEPRNDPLPPSARRALEALGVGMGATLDPRPGEYVAMVNINTLGLRGYPLFTSGLDWVRMHREFLRDRSALSAARAKFATRTTVSGGRERVKEVAALMANPDAMRPTTEGLRQSRAADLVHNQGVDFELVSPPMDGASARQDERSLRTMALLPSGLPPHWMGDLGEGNLATAAAVDKPVENMLVSYQGIWMDFYESMLRHIALWRGFTGDTTVDIDAPAIFGESLAELAQVITAITGAFPAVKHSREVLSLLLTELGLNNVEEVIAAIEEFMDEEPEAAAAVGAAMEALREARGGGR